MESWEDEDFEPTLTPAVTVPASNKWEGEDEEDEIKESWEDEDEEEKTEEKPEEVKPKPKKQTLAEKIAEKERRKREELEKRLREQQEQEISPEEKLRIQKESDLNLALETTFGTDDSNNKNGNNRLENLDLPDTKEEYQEFGETLAKKLLPLSKNTEYPIFAESLIRNLCATMTSNDMRKIKTTLDNLYLEKQKIEKGDKAKKSKGKGKAKLKMDDNNALSAYVNDYVDYDDFM